MRRVFVFSVVAVMALLAVGCCACRKGKNAKPEDFIFTFDADGHFGGKGACNRMMGSYTTTDKGGITFGNVASTRMMCPNVDLEAELSKILEDATHYEIDGDMLMLLSNGEMQAVFQAVEASAKSDK